MHQILLSLLALLARAIVRFHKPYIIGITGTVGKTTVTSHVHGFLSLAFPKDRIGHSPDHYNGEYGLPLTIIGARTGGKNPFKWAWVFLRGLTRFFAPYPRYLVLEYGIDHVGEMDFLLSIAVPDIVIITEVAPNHLEQFGSFDAYRAEKLKLALTARELIIHDTLRDRVEREAYYYGIGAMSDIHASAIEITPAGTSGVAHFLHDEYSLHVRSIGVFHIINVLPLYGVAQILGIDMTLIAQYANHALSEPGRANIFDGIGGSKIIDGSYNGGYLSLHAGIDSMRSFLPAHHLVFVLGDMRELGNETEFLHTKLADEIVSFFPSHRDKIEFYLVGPMMRQYVAPILEKKFTTQSSLSSRAVGSLIQTSLKKSGGQGTIIYVKGSQNTIFLEETVEILLAQPDDAKKLCRQTKDWKKKKEAFFSSLGA